jgi:hypothetical protein
LEKPNVPPPTVPSRPPPIGFNVSLDSKATNEPLANVEYSSPTLIKPPKPALPRKPVNTALVTSNSVTNQQQGDDDVVVDVPVDETVDTVEGKISSEITSL